MSAPMFNNSRLYSQVQSRPTVQRASVNERSTRGFYTATDLATLDSVKAQQRTTVSAYDSAPSGYASQSKQRLRTSTPTATSRGYAVTSSHVAAPLRSQGEQSPSKQSSAQLPQPVTSFITQVQRQSDTPTTRESQGSIHAQQILRSSQNIKHPAHHKHGYILEDHAHAHNRHLLVLDLDETLIHASTTATKNYDVSFDVDMGTYSVKVYIKIRPHMMAFLRSCAAHFEVVVFTASLPQYASQVLDYIDPTGQLIHHRLYRHHCTEIDGSYVKDLSILGRHIDRVSIVDNSPTAYMFHPDNAIGILSWFDDMSDTELLKLIPVLERMSKARAVYNTISQLKQFATAEGYDL